MENLKGTKTEKNLMEAFAGESQARNNILTMLLRQEKMVLNKLPQFLKKLLIMKKNMQNYGLKSFMVVKFLVH